MPARQTVTVFEALEFSVEPAEKPNPVYYTSDEPEFLIHIENNGAKYDFSEHSEFRWTIETDAGKVVHEGCEQFGPLDDGEETTLRVGGKVLAYDGHSVFGISAGSASGTGTERWALRPGKPTGSEPAYSFSVWDRSDYEASVKQPKKLQKALLFTSVLLILFAAVQLVVAAVGIL